MGGWGCDEGVNVRSTWTYRAIPTVLLAVVLAYGGAIRNGFLYDDYHLIAENPGVITHAWGAIWTSTDAASRDLQGRGFRPATLSSYVIDHAVGGGRPMVYHATQVAFHAAVVWLVYVVATAMGLTPWWAAVSALLVGLHPIQTEAVHYLSARSSVLSTLALLIAFWAYLRWRDQPTTRRAWHWVSLGFLALAVLSKESAIVGLVWFAAYERLIAGATWLEAARRLSVHAAVAAVSVVPVILVLDAGTTGASVGTATALATGVSVVGKHLGAWIAPFAVSPVSPHRWVGWGPPAVWVAVVAIAMSAFAAYALRRRLPLVSWGLVCGGSSLLPVLALPLITDVALFQPHRGYPAAVGLAVATAALAQAGARGALAALPSDAGRRALRLAGWALAGTAVIAAIAVDARVGRLWTNEVRFWSDAVTRYPHEAAYQHSLGAARLRAGDTSGAQEALMTAARLDPLLPRLDFNLGVVYTKLGQYDEAIRAYERAVARDSTDVKALANLGVLFERTGDPDRAILAYDRALTIDPTLIPIQRNLSRLSTIRSTGPPNSDLPTADR